MIDNRNQKIMEPGGAPNVDCYRMGLIVCEVANTPHGDAIDYGLHLLDELRKKGYTVTRAKEPQEW